MSHWSGPRLSDLVYRLAYNRDVAAGQLAVFQGGPSRLAVAKRPYLNAYGPSESRGCGTEKQPTGRGPLIRFTKWQRPMKLAMEFALSV